MLPVLALIVFSACCLAFANFKVHEAKRTTNPVSPAGFALLELYTSEGCSSCPPADALLGKIQQEYAGKPVFALAFHVDYWDRLGWKDAFSDVKFTNRQFEYSRLLDSQLYTPQLVVNGQTELIGSDEKSVKNAVEGNLAAKSENPLLVSYSQSSDQLNIEYGFDGSRDLGELKVAVVQKKATRTIKRGENEGRTLTHWQIVRALYTFTLERKASKQFTIPAGFDRDKYEIIAFVQNPKTGKIAAVAKADAVKSVEAKPNKSLQNHLP